MIRFHRQMCTLLRVYMFRLATDRFHNCDNFQLFRALCGLCGLCALCGLCGLCSLCALCGLCALSGLCSLACTCSDNLCNCSGYF